MAEYIDKKQLDRKFIIKMLAPTTTTIFDVRDIIDELPTADVIERSKIDKAIEKMGKFKDDVANTKDLYAQSCVEYCIAILKGNIGG